MKSVKSFAGKCAAIVAAIALGISLGISLNAVSAVITPPATAFPNALGNTLSSNMGFVNKALTADTNSIAVRTGPYATCSLQLATAVGTSNATTIKIQGSNTQGAWDDYNFNVITGTTTAQAVLYSFNAPPVEYMRVFVDLTNASPVTFTTGLFCK